MKTISMHIHSFSLRFHFQYKADFDVFRFIELAAEEGFTGVNISANGPGYRDLGGTTPDHFERVRQTLIEHDMKCEIDTCDTRVENLERMLGVAEAVEADQLRVYTKYPTPPQPPSTSGGESRYTPPSPTSTEEPIEYFQPPLASGGGQLGPPLPRGEELGVRGDSKTNLAQIINWTIRDLKSIAPLAEEKGITIVLENHEDFQGETISHILAEVDHPHIRALYDYGNSQMVGEDPLVALKAMQPYTTAVHIKDHVVVRHQGKLVVQGVPIGQGLLPIMAQTEQLYAGGLRRFCFENVWAYAAPVLADEADLPDTPCFSMGHDHFYLEGEYLAQDTAIREEWVAFRVGWDWLKQQFMDAGFEIRRKN